MTHTRSEDAEARKPEAGGNASAQPGQAEGEAERLPLQGAHVGLIIPGKVLPQSRAFSTSVPPLSGKGLEKLSL